MIAEYLITRIIIWAYLNINRSEMVRANLFDRCLMQFLRETLYGPQGKAPPLYIVANPPDFA